eukprot:tig00021494_g21927.t1
MAGDITIGHTYSGFTGFVFIFNLIVGVGALALPSAFRQAGVVLSTVFLLGVGFLSYIAATYVVEAIAIANALLYQEEEEDERLEGKRPAAAAAAADEATPLLKKAAAAGGGGGATPVRGRVEAGWFEIDRRVELATLSDMFFGPRGRLLFFATLAAYLYGDLTIYAVSVPLTLARTLQTPALALGPLVLPAYHAYLFCFAAFVLPFCFFNFQRTAYLQFGTMAVRNLAFLVMVLLAAAYAHSTGGARAADVPLVQPSRLPLLFGTAIYSFMCHHSVPSIVAPIRNKASLGALLAGVFGAVAAAYLALCYTALAAFGSVRNGACRLEPGPPCAIQPLYSLNFASSDWRFLARFLALFPVFTLSSNFPLIAITLRNNLSQLYFELAPPRRRYHPPHVAGPHAAPDCEQADEARLEAEALKGGDDATGHERVSPLGAAATLLAVAPPLALAAATQNVKLLVGVTGSFAGLAIQFVIPPLLVLAARRLCRAKLGPHAPRLNPHRSPFGAPAWAYGMLAWAALCLAFTSYQAGIALFGVPPHTIAPHPRPPS